MSITIGLERLVAESDLHKNIKGNIGLLCHSASIDKDLELAVTLIQKVFGDRLKKIFGPQHGFVTDVQDNMVETKDFIHPYFKLPIHSLYSETRIPSDEMLEGIDSIIVDLQDVGTRVYTYITTLGLLMAKCQEKGIQVVVLDRPNPVGGDIVEGNVLLDGYQSFVGHHNIPQRHGMTMGEVANYTKKFHTPNCDLLVVPMKGWKRSMFIHDTNRPWVNPSPNLPTMDGALTFVGTVLFEGTNISEGRGTTRSLEVVGHPDIEPFSFVDTLEKKLSNSDLKGFKLRPLMFMPTFQKHANTPCGGVQIHVTDRESFRPWTVGQFLCRELYTELKDRFEFHSKPYEYEFDKLAIDLINGTDEVKKWVYESGDLALLKEIELRDMDDYMARRSECLIY